MAIKLEGIANELSPRSSKAKGDHIIVLMDNDSGFRAGTWVYGTGKNVA